MVHSSRLPNAPRRLADRLEAARRGRFVGREGELAAFRSALVAAEPQFSVMYIHGSGGVGKTALLREFAQLVAEHGRPAVCLDARTIEPTQAGLQAALEQASGVPATAEWPEDGVLIVDTYELLAPLDAWLRETFLPRLPAGSIVVLAGRIPPAAEWRADLGWGSLTRTLTLQNLTELESRAYLEIRGIPDAQHASALAFTHGHPLALSLVADALARGDQLAGFNPRESPDIVRVLLRRMVDEAPDILHRQALEVCILAWATTEALLADVLQVPNASALFAWLQRLSIIEPAAEGLFPHDVAREVLDADLRWRNPDELQTVSRRIAKSLYARLGQHGRVAQQRIWFDLLHLNRHDPFYEPYFDWDSLGQAYAGPATPAEHGEILAMVEQHQGVASMEIARYWLARQPDAFLVYLDLAGKLLGFMGQIAIDEASAEDRQADPAIVAAYAFMQRRGPVRPGEEVAYLRFWMHKDAYQGASAAVNLTAINSSIFWSTHPRLAWNFIAVGSPEFLEPHFASVHMWRELKSKPKRLPEPDEWPADAQAPIRVLARDEFATAVRQALRDYSRPHQLAGNPLIQTRLVGFPSQDSPAKSLQPLLRESIATLRSNPRDAKLHRALWHTYIEPAPTQEQAAELLGLPFNTYRYHLVKGIEWLTDRLWQQYIDGGN